MNAKEYLTLTNSASKRALFTSHSSRTLEKSDDEDSLGHMSPLRSSSPDRYSSPCHSPSLSVETPLKMSDTDDNSMNNGLTIMETQNSFQAALNECTPQKTFTDIIGDTPEKDCNGDMLTPFKCLIQRRHIEETPDSSISKGPDAVHNFLWKKKEQIMCSPEKNKDPEKGNFDFNSNVTNLIKNSFYRPAQSKAKTSLFPLMVKMNKSAVKIVPKPRFVRHTNVITHFNKNHKRPRPRLGEINAGVRHKIKKPKYKVKRSVEPVKKCLEKPLISPEDRVEKYIIENNLLSEGNTPVKRPPLRNEARINSKDNEKMPELQTVILPDKSTVTNGKENVEKLPEIEVAPDPNKKFFKTNRTMAIDHKATVTVVNNVKIEVHNGKLALGNSPVRRVKPFKKRPVLLENVFEEDPVLDTNTVHKTVEEVLQKLDNEIDPPNDLHNILSITSSTSSLALNDCEMVNAFEPINDQENQNIENSSKDAITRSESVNDVENVNPENTSDVDSPDASKKLYPVFYKHKALYDASNTTNTITRRSPHIKKMRLIGENQYQIDAGQSRFKATICRECGTMYHVGDPEDEIAHYNIHNNVSTFRFAGWKNEHVIKLYANAERVIVIYPDDPKVWVKKAQDILAVVDKEMGFVDFDAAHVGNNKIYLYIQKNRIIGVLSAEPKNEAFRMLDTGIDGPDCCSEETYPVICGISRIWTAPDQRRKGVATRLVDSLRLSFMFDHFLDKKEIAFSVPTDQGKSFATKYMNTAEFMVFYK